MFSLRLNNTVWNSPARAGEVWNRLIACFTLRRFWRSARAVRLMFAMIASTLILGGALWAHAQTPPPASEAVIDGAVRFIAVDVFVDSGDQALAAFQFEFTGPEGVSSVGVEGGESNAFRSPPYYDPEALTQGRIIVAAFNTGRDLPTGQTRVARLHLRTQGELDSQFSVKLIVAGNADGQPIEANSSVIPVNTSNTGN
ncbi:MAG: hypothetical protein IPK83_07010 [Planctomycetes bacterium]|nr:hypothetical protein [Planctomycetota bacterium]